MTYSYKNRKPVTSETHDRPHHRVYRTLYKTHNAAPYLCFYCNEEMLLLEVVHHIDENPWNNSISNLAASHTDCHNKHHHIDIVMSEDSNNRRSMTLRNTFSSWTDEQRQNRAEWTKKTWIGRKHRPETIEKMKLNAQTRPRASCLGCNREMTVNGLKKHNKDKNCPPMIGVINASE